MSFRAVLVVSTRDERNCHHSVALSVWITLDRCAAAGDAVPRAERIVALVAIVVAWPKSGFRRSGVRAREIVVGNVALAVLHREGVGLREPIIQEQLLYPGDVDVHRPGRLAGLARLR